MMLRSKRVSFNKEITIKEFVNKTGNSTAESDIDSPDLYRAPISNTGGGGHDDGMDETCLDIASSDMELTETAIGPGELTETTIGPGELTTMFSRPDTKVQDGEDGMERAISVERLQMVGAHDLDVTRCNDIKSLARVMLSGDTSDMFHDSTIMDITGNDSDSSIVRRSVRLARLSSESASTPDYRTPPVKLKKGRKRGLNSSLSKHKKISSGNNTSKDFSLLDRSNTSLLAGKVAPTPDLLSQTVGASGTRKMSSIRTRKNVSLLSNFNETNISSVSKLASIDLLENSAETSSTFSCNDNQLVPAGSDGVSDNRQKLRDILEQKRRELEELKVKLQEEQQRTQDLWSEYEVKLNETPHPSHSEFFQTFETVYAEESKRYQKNVPILSA